ncbi:MAG: conjugal transfer protein TraN [Rhodocyclaceae bacterium]|nr:MAG: conjugal transfer protein TraN [Rhodocyclaceae bacterium]
MRTMVVWITLVCFVATQNTSLASSHDEGLVAGQAANPVIRDSVTAPSALSVVPGYTTAPPETAYFGQPGLTGAANARLAACAGSSDPACQAQTTALTSANTPRPGVSAYGPAVSAARDIARNPSTVLESLSSYYSGCTTAGITAPAGTVNKVCNRYSGVGNYTTRRDLTVQVALAPSCVDSVWFAHAQANRNGADYMVVEAQCHIRTDGLQRFRFYAAGGRGACIGWQTLDLPTTPATQATYVTDLSPHWEGYCWSPFKVMLLPGSGCANGQCRYTFQFGTPVYACPAGTVLGDTLSLYSDFFNAGPGDQCYAITESSPDGNCLEGIATYDDIGTHCAVSTGDATLMGASGWSLTLAFTQPAMVAQTTDVWVDKSAALADGGRCMVTTADRCVDGPATKLVDGQPVTRTCWSYERTLTCSSGTPLDECVPLLQTGCSPSTSVCKQRNAATGQCEITQATYACPSAAQTVTTAANCPTDVYCLGNNCFNTRSPNDADFARSMTLLEAAREAGVYLDTSTMQVFKGEANSCRDQLLQNCCYSDNAGAAMSNQSLFGMGSRLVFDILMNSENQDFLIQGMQALLMDGGFAGTFTSYGVTVAVNGAALPAGSVALYSGENVLIAVDPWSLAITATFYVVMSMMSCSDNEGKLAMKEGAHLCHTVGTYCSSCLRILGVCVACIEHTTGKCCFNSKLARIINEQGRTQVGKGWGSAENPDCSGFTVAQLQQLNFAAMDLSEFYASLVPTLPNASTLQGNNAARLNTCYYGQGRCQ